jgi:hypothetical protein
VVPDTCTNAETIVLSSPSVNESRKPASTAGMASGRVTFTKVRNGGA